MMEQERSNIVYPENNTIWTGKIGLLYPSDYGYATSGGGDTTDRTTCLLTLVGKPMYAYGVSINAWSSSDYSDCKENDWLYFKTNTWTISQLAINPTGYQMSSDTRKIVLPITSSGLLYAYTRDTGSSGNYLYGFTFPSSKFDVYPSLYLKSQVKIIEDGSDGSSTNPFKLSID